MNPDVSAFALSPRCVAAPCWRRLFLSLLLCSAMGTGLLRATSMDVPVPEWREGPIRYLLTKLEAKVY